MISAKEAQGYAREHFPNGPEDLVRHLGIELRESPMQGGDGWCMTDGSRSLIRINSKLGKRRKRFTLAHELGHLILGIPSVVGESFTDMLKSSSDEEKRVDDFASKLLLPKKVIRSCLSELPVVAGALQKLAKKANVSVLATAIRVASIAEDIGLKNAAVVYFDSHDKVAWQWSKTLQMPNETAELLLEESRKIAPLAFREHRKKKGDVIVSSLIENPYFGSATLFVQLLSENDGLRQSSIERRKELEGFLYADGSGYRPNLEGCFGAFKGGIGERTLDEAVAVFEERYREKFKDTSLASKQGREYIRLRITEWF